jgi:hypothetical protein
VNFRAVLETNGKTATGIEVPPEVVTSLGSGRRPAVRVTFNGFTYRTTVAPMGGRFLVPVSANVRAESAVTAGDVLDVEITLDTEPRTVAIPADLEAAFAGEPTLRAVWDKLAFTHQREHAEAIEGAKKPETRRRRIDKAVDMLRARS